MNLERNMSRIDAIDISHWNTVTNFAQVAQSGVIGCFMKCTEGTSYIDPTYASRMPQAVDAGLCVAAYHFLKHGNIGDQMDWFVSQAGLPGGARVAIDYEDPACTLDDLEHALAALSDLDPALQIAIYAGGLLKGQVSSSASYPWLEPYPLWLAQYTSGSPSWPTNIWPTYSLWQWSQSGSVPGISGDCDVNQFNGSPENCARWFGPVIEPVPPEPSPVGEVVIAVTVPDGMSVAVIVNGQEILRSGEGRMQAGRVVPLGALFDKLPQL
jgi:lysozyme